jgi:hypothetical protein
MASLLDNSNKPIQTVITLTLGLAVVWNLGYDPQSGGKAGAALGR